MEKKNYRFIEVTPDNESQYLDQIADLEVKVLNHMESHGQIGQLFTTGKEDISSYVHSDSNSVLVAVDDSNRVAAATYITQGQIPFTYNDITKYFKSGTEYENYVKGLYPSITYYHKAMLDAYELKMKAFKYASQKISEEYPEYKGDILQFLNHELEQEHNHFDEKSPLRDKLNAYMSSYVLEVKKTNPDAMKLYERFYWLTSKDISREFKREVRPSIFSDEIFEKLNAPTHDEVAYREVLTKGPLDIHEKPNFDQEKYYSANTDNAIELDTYITDPDNRKNGLSKMLLINGIEKYMRRFFNNTSNDEIFLCSTLHRDNLSSKYVSEFFGLTDNLFVKRRDGRDREVHICRIKRDEYEQYLSYMKKKIAVLYGYNPEYIKISSDDEKSILQEQLAYEQKEKRRIRGAKAQGKKYVGVINYESRKDHKIKALIDRLNELNRTVDFSDGHSDQDDR